MATGPFPPGRSLSAWLTVRGNRMNDVFLLIRSFPPHVIQSGYAPSSLPAHIRMQGSTDSISASLADYSPSPVKNAVHRRIAEHGIIGRYRDQHEIDPFIIPHPDKGLFCPVFSCSRHGGAFPAGCGRYLCRPDRWFWNLTLLHRSIVLCRNKVNL